MKKRKKQAKPAKARPKHAASAVATGAKLAALAGRPSKQAVTAVFGTSGYALSWLARAERLGITPVRLCTKFKSDPEGVKADWVALTAEKA
jgi:predicted alpha/beta hydrolase